jgi:predicted TIM-barrel fold metal-dependent hydrolase
MRPEHIVDVHTHIFEEEYREQLINETLLMDFVKQLGLIRGSDGRLSSLLRSADENNISKFFILPVVKTPKKVQYINNLYYRESKKDSRIVFCGTIFPGGPSFNKEILLDLKSKDAKVIKIHSIHQKIDILDDASLQLFEEITNAGLPVIFDTSCIPVEYLSSDDDTRFHTTPGKLLKLHDILPGLKIIAAHGGGHFISDKERRKLIGRRIYIELSATRYNCDWPRNDHNISLKNFIYLLNNHYADMLLFGTDNPWRNQKREIEEFIELYKKDLITKTLMENIFWKNASRLFKLDLER